MGRDSRAASYHYFPRPSEGGRDEPNLIYGCSGNPCNFCKPWQFESVNYVNSLS